MNLKNYPHFCNGKRFCELCRAKEAGQAFRAMVNKHLFNEPGDNFECPYGFEWDAKIEPDAAFNAPSQKDIPKLDVNAAKQRFDICKKCERSSDGGFKCALHKGCCFGAWRTRPENACPLGKWVALDNCK